MGKKKIIKVDKISTSFVKSDLKFCTDKGSGESKLFVGSAKNKQLYEDFFQFKTKYKYYVNKQSLINYLYMVKFEYELQCFNQYRNVSKDKWNKMYEKISKYEKNDIEINLREFADDRRYYVRSDDEIFKEDIRNLILPKMSMIKFIKDEEAEKITIYLDLCLDEFKQNRGNDEVNTIILTENFCDLPQNRIISGAPGTGKSFKYETEKDEYFSEYQYERVTFHPAYSYAHFFGCYKPVNGVEGIEYKFVPGPFVRVWLKAMADPEHNYLLLIEEINRAEVAAVFGDVFQLLDRKDGISQYPIDMSEDLRKYITSGEWQENIKTSIEEIDTSQKMIIPQNMFIWATMNSADQGVYPMDTAFKRRWDYEYMPLDNKDVEEKLDKRDIKLVREKAGNEYQVQRFTWNEVRMAINNFLSGANINEDKLMGPFFLSDSVVGAGRDAEDEIEFWEKFEEAFQNKVLLYLFEDAGKSKRPTLFEGAKPNHNRYSGIREEFANKGMRIFHEDISSKVRYKSIADEDKQQEQNNEVETNEGSQP